MKDDPWNTDILVQLRVAGESHVEMALRRPGYLTILPGAEVLLRGEPGFCLPVIHSVVLPEEFVHRVFLEPYHCESVEHRDSMEKQLREKGWEMWEENE